MKNVSVFIVIAISFFAVFMVASSLWAVEPSKVAPARPVTPKESTTAKPTVQQSATVLPQINIVSPAEATSWYMGETHDIGWIAILPGTVKVAIELVLPGGKKQKLAEVPPSPNKYTWNITASSFASQDVQGALGVHKVYFDTNATLRLSAVHEGKTYASERDVKLLVPKIKITSPNEGAVWNVGKTYTVTWKKEGPLASTVNIFIGGGGIFIPSFTMQTGNTGSASLTLPASALFQNWPNKYLLKVETELATSQFGAGDSVVIDLKP